MINRISSIHPIAAAVAFVALTAFAAAEANAEPKAGAVRVLFLGHESAHHNSNKFYPMLAKGLGRDAIYFDYVTTVEGALGDAEFLDKFDALLLYANHGRITPRQWRNLKAFVEGGKGFVPVHCASWCFGNEPGFDQLVGGRFASHKTGTFTAKVVDSKHPAMAGVKEFEAWDETYKHKNHNKKDRQVLMVREVTAKGDNITEPEPWTWVRTQGKGRVFYTASGHDERVWSQSAFHQLLKAGILWTVGDERKQSYEKFIAGRTPLKYEKRDHIPNYEKRPEPLPYQFPLSAKDSMEYTQAPVGFRLELFASEPDVINPIGLAWDERGRLWVAETVDYPNEMTPNRVGNDKIKILEDTDGDGRCDKVTVFADGLNIPTSLTFSRGGIIVAHVPDFLFLKDTDGDDKADLREVISTGWGTGDTHAGPSNLRYGFDNWIWGTVGYSSFSGKVGGEQKRFGSGVFRIKPDGSDLEFLHQFNNNTWGLGFNSAGDVFGSTANNNPSFFCGIPATAYGGKKGMSARMIAVDRSFHPITPNVRQVDAFDNYTAGAGQTVATSAGFPESFRDKVAFISGPTGHLLGKYHLSRDGSGYKAKNGYAFLASADEWFSPVAAEVGPDGNLWVADWYNFIIQHNPTPNRARGGYDAKRGKGNAHINPNRDRGHGRIYRVVWEKTPKPKIKSLDDSSDAPLVAAMDSDNLFWRLTAQRLLVDGARKGAAAGLRSKVKAGGAGAIQALWSLHGLGSLDKETHQQALLSKDPALRRNAIKALGNDEAALQLFFDTAVVQDADLIVRLAAFNKMVEFEDKDTIAHAAKKLITESANADDMWLSQSLRNAGAGVVKKGPRKLGKNLIVNGSFEKLDRDVPTGWKTRLFRGEKAKHEMSDLARTGKRSIEISSDKPSEFGLHIEIPVEKHAEYELSGWIKTENVSGSGRGAQLYVSGHPDAPGSQGVKGTKDWTRVNVEFKTYGEKSAKVYSLFGGWGTASGKAWWDDVSLRKIEYEVIASDEPEIAKGDVERGKKIFMHHSIAACIRCHVVKGVGGPVGPALDTIATRKNEDYILQSLVDPGATIAEGYVGKVSPMPPMGVLLKPQELADIMAYLLTLK